MKRDLIYLTLIAALMAAAQVTAQTAPEAPAEIRPLRIEAGVSKTVHILFPVTARSYTGLSGRAKTDTSGLVSIKEAATVTTEITAITFMLNATSFFNFSWFCSP